MKTKFKFILIALAALTVLAGHLRGTNSEAAMGDQITGMDQAGAITIRSSIT